jgi:hypothetical protein
MALLGIADWEGAKGRSLRDNLEGDHLEQTGSAEPETLNLAHGDWQIKRWDCQRGQRRGEIGSPGTAVPQRESRGGQAPVIERMGGDLGPPSCFAKTAVGQPSSVALPSSLASAGPFRK